MVRADGKLDFQLYVLDCMRGAGHKVDEALDALGVTRESMNEVGDEIRDELNLIKFRKTLDNVRSIMGKPEWEEVVPPLGEGRVAVAYALPVWPEFYFRILGGSDGSWIDGGFVRREGMPVPLTGSPAQLAPWGHLLGEVEERFGPLAEGDLWYPYADYSTECRDEEGVLRKYFLQFSWGLLQQTFEGPRV